MRLVSESASEGGSTTQGSTTSDSEQRLGSKEIAMKKLQILGTGCSKCKSLTEQVELAAKELGIEHRIEKVTDLQEIVSFGVMTTPALAVDGQIKVAGNIPSIEELKRLIA